MVERFNGRISDVLQSHHFVSGEDLAQTLYRYVLLYNQQLPQSTLGSKTPLDAMQRWYESHPHLFVKRPCNLAGGDRSLRPPRNYLSSIGLKINQCALKSKQKPARATCFSGFWFVPYRLRIRLGIRSLTMSYFHTGTCTIIGAMAFHGPVRDGKGWGHHAMVIRHNGD